MLNDSDSNRIEPARRSARAVVLHWVFTALLLVQWGVASGVDARQLLRGEAPASAVDAAKLIPSGSRPSERASVSEGDWTVAVRQTWDAGPDPFDLPAIFAAGESLLRSAIVSRDAAAGAAVARAFHARAPPAAV